MPSDANRKHNLEMENKRQKFEHHCYYIKYPVVKSFSKIKDYWIKVY
jgi:hypothetical protein